MGMKITLLVLGFAVLVIACTVPRKMLFPRHMIPASQIAAGPPAGVEAIWIDSPEGKVEAWFIPGKGVNAESPGPVVIFSHGNAELIDNYPGWFRPYQELGVSVLLAEFRGYGRSSGTPSQEAITEDFIAFYDSLTQRPDVDVTRIVYHGRSVGGGAVCALAEVRPPAAMILQSTFTSVPDVAGPLVPSVIIRDKFDNRSAVANILSPMLILHGKLDEIIPYQHGEALHAAAPNSTLHSYRGGHNDEPPYDFYWSTIEQFLRTHDVLSSE